jgi:hypothetical protein
MKRLTRIARAPTIAAAALTLLVAACGSNDASPDPVGEPAAATRSADADVEVGGGGSNDASPDPVGEPAAATRSADADIDVDGGGSNDASPDPVGEPAAATRSADADVDVDGDELALGRRAVSPFVDYGGREQPTTVGVRVLSVRKGRIADLKDFNLDRKQRRSVPYYIDAEFENLGDFALTRHLLRPSVEDGDGNEYRPATLIVLGGTFRPCPQGRDTKLRPGERFTGCSAVLLPKGTEPDRVRFQGDVTKDPLFWQPQ